MRWNTMHIALKSLENRAIWSSCHLVILSGYGERFMSDKASQHLVYINSVLVPRDEAKISVFDAAVMLGDTVTESTRTFGHKPFKLDQHIRRLYQSLKVTRIDPGMTLDEMHELSLRVLAANAHLLGPDDDCWIVHNISRGL